MPDKTRNLSQPPEPEFGDPRDDRPNEARVPGGRYYSARWEDTEAKERLERAAAVEGLDEDLAVLRWWLEEVLLEGRRDDPLALKILGLIVRAYSARSRVSDASSDPAERGIEDFLRAATDKLGLERIPWDSNC